MGTMAGPNHVHIFMCVSTFSAKQNIHVFHTKSCVAYMCFCVCLHVQLLVDFIIREYEEYHKGMNASCCGLMEYTIHILYTHVFDDIRLPSPDLTWRDVQHLIAMTAKVPDPKEPGWSVNGAGYHIHDRYSLHTRCKHTTHIMYTTYTVL